MVAVSTTISRAAKSYRSSLLCMEKIYEEQHGTRHPCFTVRLCAHRRRQGQILPSFQDATNQNTLHLLPKLSKLYQTFHEELKVKKVQSEHQAESSCCAFISPLREGQTTRTFRASRGEPSACLFTRKLKSRIALQQRRVESGAPGHKVF